MQSSHRKPLDISFVAVQVFLILFSLLVLYSIANFLFPGYLFYILLGIVIFFIFSFLDYEIVSVFSSHLYIFSLVLLIITLLIGQVSRGALRWIPIGPITIQPSEIVRPFLVLFFAKYAAEHAGKINFPSGLKFLAFSIVPLFLILVQPSLGMTILTFCGIVGVLLAIGLPKRFYFIGALAPILLVPIFYFLLQPYQKQRIVSFINPESDPLGAGYNSIQSLISVGSGRFWGRGLGKGVQTQLSFLPERHTDFIFASIGEELGFIGAGIVIVSIFFLLYKLVRYIEETRNLESRAFLTGIFVMFLVQVFINIAMNLGMAPITGLPLPLVSAGGSSFLGMMISLGMAQSARKT